MGHAPALMFLTLLAAWSSQNHYSSLPPGDESEPLKQFRTVLVRRQFCQTDQTACSEVGARLHVPEAIPPPPLC